MQEMIGFLCKSQETD